MHPKIRSLWLSETLALLSLAGTSIPSLTAFEYAVAFGQTARNPARETVAKSIGASTGQKVNQQPADSQQVGAAERVFEEGIKLYQQGTAESLRAAIAKFEEAARLYSIAGNRSGKAIALTGIRSVYTQLKKRNTSKAEALRQAQMALMQSKGGSSGKTKGSISVQPGAGNNSSSQSTDYNHPYYWAPFILIGNGL